MQSTIGVQKYNFDAHPAYTPDASGIGGAVTTAESHSTSINIDNPLVWLVGIGAVTLGLVAFSTHVRVGSFNASVSGGKG